jgi:hypothetical protein
MLVRLTTPAAGMGGTKDFQLQNENCKMKIAGHRRRPLLQFAFCILHFAFCNACSSPSPLLTRRALLLTLLCLICFPSAARAAVRAESTRHYLIHTDLDESLSADLGRRLDAMYDQYDQRLAVFHSRGAVPRLEAYLFRDQRDYVRFTEGKLQNSGGVFLPGRNLLAAFLGDQGRDQLRRTLQHEAFHQFAYNAISPDLPVWLNEGLAQFFEEGLWHGSGFLLGEVPPRRMRQLKADLTAHRLVNFATLLHMNNEQWAKTLAANRADGVTQYNQSWAMVHFLVMAKGPDDQLLYRSRILEMLRLLHSGKDANEAFQLAFGSNVEGFQDRFVEYARHLQPTAEATLIENQDVLADLLVEFDREGRRFDDIESLRTLVTRQHYRLHYSRGDISWDTDPDMNCYFSDLKGNRFSPEELYLSPRTGSPLPDIICRCAGQLALRTRFHDTAGNKVDHELLIEPLRPSASISN